MHQYTQFGPIVNGGVNACPDTAVRYRTILRVVHGFNAQSDIQILNGL